MSYKNSFRASGIFGQETIVLPGVGIVFGIQCQDHTNFDALIEVLHEELLGNVVG